MKARGGAVVELVLWTGIFTLMIAGSFELVQASLWRMRLVSAARLGAVLVGTGRVQPDVVEREVRDYLRQWPGGEPSALAVSIDRFLGVPSAPFYKLMSIRLRLRRATGTLDESVQTEQEESS